MGICSCLCTCSYLGKVGGLSLLKDSVRGLRMNPGLCLSTGLGLDTGPPDLHALAQRKRPFLLAWNLLGRLQHVPPPSRKAPPPPQPPGR